MLSILLATAVASVYNSDNTAALGNEPPKIVIIRQEPVPEPKKEGRVVCGKYPVATKDGIVDRVICEVR